MSDTATRASLAAHRLVAAWRSGSVLPSASLAIASEDEATAIQLATWRALDAGRDAPGGWKVGASGPQAPVASAPLPHGCLHGSGATIGGAGVRRRGVELELALRVSRVIDAAVAADAAALAASFDAVCAAIEVVESRLADWDSAPALAKLADLQSHYALVSGAWAPLPDGLPDLRALQAQLAFDARIVAHTRGGNRAQDLPRLLHGLAAQALARRLPLQPGQIVTTGTCTGLLFAPAATEVRGVVGALPAVVLRFS